jgi:hypothetical protein
VEVLNRSDTVVGLQLHKIDGRVDAIGVTIGVLGMKFFGWHTGIGYTFYL